jgi:hypothetical protein
MLKSNSGLKLNRGNFDQDSEEKIDEDVEEDEESHGDPLEGLMRKAMERMMNPSGASSSNAVPRHGSAIGRPTALRRAPGGGGSRDDGHAAQEPDLNTMVMLLIAKKLLSEKGSSSNDYDDDGDLNGMKVMKALSRSRAQRDHMRSVTGACTACS